MIERRETKGASPDGLDDRMWLIMRGEKKLIKMSFEWTHCSRRPPSSPPPKDFLDFCWRFLDHAFEFIILSLER